MKWMSNPEVKDKTGLQDARRRIEIEMERFKAFERESKTKPFSLVGLAMTDRVDARELRKQEKREPLEEFVDRLNFQTEEFRAEWEALTAKKKKTKDESEKIELLKRFIDWHAFHLRSLEQVLRRLDNDVIDPDDLDFLIESLTLYFDQFEESDYYHDDGLYEQFSLDSDAVDVTYYNPTLDESIEEGKTNATGPSAAITEPPKVREVPLTAAAKAKAKKQAVREMEALQTGGPVRPDHPTQTPPKPSRPIAPTVPPPPLPAPPHPPSRPAPILSDLSVPEILPQDASKGVWHSGTASEPIRPPPPPPTSVSLDRSVAAIECSWATKPDCRDLLRIKHSGPSNMYIHQFEGRSIYPESSSLLPGPRSFKNLPLEVLVLSSYYREGTYSQYLATRELKRQNWRFHRKLGLWFRRVSSGVKTANPAFEHGTYSYFDISPDTWGVRNRSDFTFEYEYLDEDFPQEESAHGFNSELVIRRPGLLPVTSLVQKPVKL